MEQGEFIKLQEIVLFENFKFEKNADHHEKESEALRLEMWIKNTVDALWAEATKQTHCIDFKSEAAAARWI